MTKEKDTTTITFRIPKEMKTQLQNIAEEHFMNSSQLIRKILAEWLDKQAKGD